ncbi:MAG: MucR family transcriptional regulator [Parvularculaceae bacterium]
MSNSDDTPYEMNEALHLATDIVAAYVSNNKATASDIPELLQTTYATLQALNSKDATAQSINQKPAVPISKSITKDYIICLEDGKELKMLKRYLRSQYGMSPDDYRRKWGLPASYPMVAPNYAKRRSEFAKQIGLGRVKGQTVKTKKKKAKKKKAKRK